ncbi:TIGR03862 family flavoprotein [Alsobacter sp. R-9]
MSGPRTPFRVAVVGGGPAGLMAAEALATAAAPGELRVTVHDHMPSPARKLLIAGRGGLNLTHSEPLDRFLGRYGAAMPWLEPAVRGFDAEATRVWAAGLGQETFVGSSGRVFPVAFKASPLLRAWLARLGQLGVTLRTRSRWIGLDPDGRLRFASGPEGTEIVEDADAVILALGGGSWARLGSDAGWVPILRGWGVAVSDFAPSNCGFLARWSPDFSARFAGQPVKGVALSLEGRSSRGEIMITAGGLEGGAVYALSGLIRDRIAGEGAATLHVDLKPDQTVERLAERLDAARPGESLSTRLRKRLNLSPAAVGLLRESTGRLPSDASALAALVKAVPVRLVATAGLERAISSAGGVAADAFDPSFMLKARPGVFVAGEMLDWEAPTGGYLLQACLATGRAAGLGTLAWLRSGGRLSLAHPAPLAAGRGGS